MNITLKKYGNFSPLRYPGGKSSLAGYLSFIINSLKLHRISYVEPYAGGAGAALSLLFLERVERIVINDLDSAVYAFWKAITQHSSWFIERLMCTEVSTAEWHNQKSIYTLAKDDKTKELGFAFFYLNRVNHSGIIEGWPIGGIRQTGKWKINARFNKIELANRIRRISLYSNRITVSNSDGLSLAQEIIETGTGFMYLDPPYYAKGKSLYLNHLDYNSHAALAQCLNRNSKSLWVLTYDNVPEIRELYKKRAITEYSLHYSAHSSRTGSEILIASDRVTKLLRAL